MSNLWLVITLICGVSLALGALFLIAVNMRSSQISRYEERRKRK